MFPESDILPKDFSILLHYNFNNTVLADEEVMSEMGTPVSQPHKLVRVLCFLKPGLLDFKKTIS